MNITVKQIVCVTHVENSLVKSMKGFPNTDQGVKDAEQLFAKIAKALGCKKSYLETAIMDSQFEHPTEMGSSVNITYLDLP